MIRSLAILFAIFWGAAASAQAPISKDIEIVFQGTVVDNIDGTIRIRQPDGTIAPYTGPVPDYPYKAGDPFSLSLIATVPTAAFYDPAVGPFRGDIPDDGLFRISVRSPYYSGGTSPGGVGNLGRMEISGQIQPVLSNSQPTTFGNFDIVYDLNNDSYSLDLRDEWYLGLLDGPGLFYDPLTNRLTSAPSTCEGGSPSKCINSGDGGFGFTGSNNAISAQSVRIYGTDPNFPSETNGSIYGLFDLAFSGNWNLPLFGQPDPTPVPEPVTMLLFGAGASGLAWRRRRGTRAK